MECPIDANPVTGTSGELFSDRCPQSQHILYCLSHSPPYCCHSQDTPEVVLQHTAYHPAIVSEEPKNPSSVRDKPSEIEKTGYPVSLHLFSQPTRGDFSLEIRLEQ